MVKAINSEPRGYKPPSFEKLCTTLVDKKKAHVEEEMAPLKHAWTIDYCSIMMDGWTHVHNRPLLNIIMSFKQLISLAYRGVRGRTVTNSTNNAWYILWVLG